MKTLPILFIFWLICLSAITSVKAQEEDVPDVSSFAVSPGAKYQNIEQKIKDFINNHAADTGENDEVSNLKRWKWYWDNHFNCESSENAGKFTAAPKFMAQQFVNPICASNSNNASNWNLIGPKSQPVNSNQWSMGLVSAVAQYPGNPDIVYCGTSKSGCWKTTTGTQTNPSWTCITDNLHLPGLGVNDIKIDPQNPNVIYIATGFAGYGDYDYGVGLLKSIDGGQTWNATGLSYNPFNSSSTIFQRVAVRKILLHHASGAPHAILYVLCENQVLKSIDDGLTFSVVENLPPTAVSNGNGGFDYYYRFWRDIEMKPGDPNTLYIASDGYVPFHTGGAIAKISINGGSSWTDISSQLYPNTDLTERFEFSTSNATGNANNLWCSFRVLGNTNKFYLRKSTDSGLTWTTLVSTTSYADIGYWCNNLKVSDIEPLYTIYLGGISEYVGYNSNNNLSFYNYNGLLHDDKRVIQSYLNYLPGSVLPKEFVYVGTDGGIAKSIDGGVTWINMNGTGLAITQFYGMCSPEINLDIISGGTQDNGYMTYFKGGYSPSEWKRNYSGIGDAYDCVCDKNFGSTSTMYGSNNPSNQKLSKGLAKGDVWSSTTIPQMPNSVVNGISSVQKVSFPIIPIEVNPKNGNYYVAGHDIYSSSTPSIVLNTPINKLTDFSATNQIPSCYALKTFAVAPSNPQIIYAAYELPTWGKDVISAGLNCTVNTSTCNPGDPNCMNRNKVFRSTDGGANWVDIGRFMANITNTLIYSAVNTIAIDPMDPNRAWFGMSGLSDDGNGGGKNRVNYYHFDPQNSSHIWADLSLGLTPSPVFKILFQNGSQDGLYIGTDVGVFYTNSTKGFIWECYNNNFPTAIVTDLEINYCNQKLRASTFGRGIWESDLEPSYSFMSQNATWTGSVRLDNNLILSTGAHLTIDAASVNISSGCKIVVSAGAELTITNASVLNSCSKLWRGIYADNGSIINVDKNSSIEDAEYGIKATDGSTIHIDHAIFNSCYIGIYTPSQGTGNNTVYGYITGSTFKCDHLLKPNYVGMEYIPIIWAGAVQGNQIPKFETYAGIRMDDVAFSIDGGPDKNIFIGQATLPTDPSTGGMNAGIIGFNSSFNVSKCIFVNIIDRNYYDNYSAGIYVFGTSGSPTLTQSGYGKTSLINFENCSRAIFGDGVNMNIQNNNMNNVMLGVGVEWAHNRNVVIDQNTINCHWVGVYGALNESTIGLEISGNTINVGYNFPSYINKPSSGFAGIAMQEWTLDNPHTMIFDNQIYLKRAKCGISLSNVKGADMGFNNIFMENSVYNEYGLVLNACDACTFDCGTIESTDGISLDDTQRGIYIASTRNSSIACNSLNYTNQGIRIDGICLGTFLTSNDLNYHKDGLYIGNTGVLGYQTNRGNKWHIVSSTGFDAINTGSFDASRFFVNNTNPPLWPTKISPPSVNFSDPSNWFVFKQSGSTVTCAGSQICAPISSPVVSNDNEIEREIAAGEIHTPEYTYPMDREARQFLFDKLKHDNALLLSDPEFQNFYSGEVLNNTDDFQNIGDREKMLNNMAIALKTQIEQKLLTIKQSISIIDQNNEMIRNPSTSENDKATFESNNQGLYNNIKSDKNFIDNAFAIFASNRVLDAKSIRVQNNGIVTNSYYEENERIVNDVYLKMMEQNDHHLGVNEANQILNIALQCPFSGGVSVYKARALYAFIDPMKTYDDANICLGEGVVLRQSSTIHSENFEKTENVSIYPNPAKDFLNITYNFGKDIGGILEIYNPYGQKVKTVYLQSNENYILVDIKFLDLGFYNYTMKSDSGFMKNGKLIIAK